MGCGPSKDEVATGNTVSSRSLQKTQPDVSQGTTVEAVADPVPNKAEEASTTIGGGDVKDIGSSDSPEEKEGKLVSAETPNEHFSGYFSPKPEHEEGKITEAAAEEKEVVEEVKALVGEGREENSSKEDDGEPSSSQVSADFKDAILLEDNEDEEVTVAVDKKVEEEGKEKSSSIAQ